MEYTFKVFIEFIRYYPLKYFRETWQNTNRSVLITPVRTFAILGRAFFINFGEIWTSIYITWPSITNAITFIFFWNILLQ